MKRKVTQVNVRGNPANESFERGHVNTQCVECANSSSMMYDQRGQAASTIVSSQQFTIVVLVLRTCTVFKRDDYK
jgi:hypothetical protein